MQAYDQNSETLSICLSHKRARNWNIMQMSKLWKIIVKWIRFWGPVRIRVLQELFFKPLTWDAGVEGTWDKLMGVRGECCCRAQKWSTGVAWVWMQETQKFYTETGIRDECALVLKAVFELLGREQTSAQSEDRRYSVFLRGIKVAWHWSCEIVKGNDQTLGKI